MKIKNSSILCLILIISSFSICFAASPLQDFSEDSNSSLADSAKLQTTNLVNNNIAGDSLLVSTPQKEFVPKWYDMFKNLPEDWVRYSKQTFTKDMIPAIVGMTVLTTAMCITDETTWRTTRGWYIGSKAVRKASDIFEYMGDGVFQFSLAAAFGTYGVVFKNDKALRTASQTVEVILAAGGVVQLLKHITGRESPIVETQKGGRWDLFPNQKEYAKHVPHYDAFPSGHICTATSTLVVIMENYPDATWLKPVGYTVLGLISTSLVTTSIHWWSDVPLGIAIGYAFGKICAHPLDIALEKTADDKPKTSLQIMPSYSKLGPNLNMNLSF
jgi:membrane-associated phospholipid phosphatase